MNRMGDDFVVSYGHSSIKKLNRELCYNKIDTIYKLQWARMVFIVYSF